MAHRHRFRTTALLSGLLLVGLAGCGGPAAPRDAAAPPDPEVAEVTNSLTSPWGMVALRDGGLLVSERDTRTILRVGAGAKTVLATLDAVQPGGEGGLLGLAATSDQQTIFAYYTAAADNQIVAMSWDGQTLGTPRPILGGIPKGSRHDGGRLVVGPDQLLYVGTGDTGDDRLAQDTTSLAGKILRLSLDGRPAPGNPFGNAIFSFGHRNVQGLAFDDQGRLWASEFGSDRFDELNLITRGGNYGWPEVEGSGQRPGLIDPKLVWPTADASPSGLAYWRGKLWMAALGGRRLWQIPVDGETPGAPQARFVDTYGRLRSVIVAADGQSLLLSTSNTDGRGDAATTDDRVLRVSR